MTGKGIATVVISALVGGAVAIAACVVFFFLFVKQPPGVVAGQPPLAPNTAPTPVVEPTREPDVPVEKVTAIEFETTYRRYWPAGDKCAKSYNEVHGNDGRHSNDSPCRILIRFESYSQAKRTLFVSRWDPQAKETKVVEKTIWTAPLTHEQFLPLAKTVVTNDAFRNWQEGMTVAASNSSVRVENNAVPIKTVLSNVDPNTTVFLQMIGAIQRLERELNWTVSK